MKELTKILTIEDGHKMFTYNFIPENKPKAIVQIVHGLDEHAGRYKEFAQKLADNDFLVCAEDHRGFGRSAITKEKIGDMGERGHELVIDDLKYLMDKTKAEYGDLPYFMFGHSMGSFLTRGFLIKYHSSLNGAIIMGTKGNFKGFEKFGKIIANIQKAIFGGSKRAKFLSKLANGGYGRKYFPEDNSSFAWMTSDKEEIKKVKEDEYFSKIPPSVETYIQIFHLLEKISNSKNYSDMNKDFPILLISGDKDPVGNMGEGVKWVYEMYKSLGFTDINISLYKNGRHEILNDFCRQDVMNEIVEWLNKHLKN